MYDRLDAEIAYAMMGINAVKGVLRSALALLQWRSAGVSMAK